MRKTALWKLLTALSAVAALSACALSINGLEAKSGSSSSPEFGFTVDWVPAAASIMPLDAAEPLLNKPAQAAAPIASTAKVITALTVLQKNPLQVGESGPIIELSQADVELYQRYLEMNGSVLPVYQGMRLSLRQMLEAMLLPSANNIADTLAIWAFGSLQAYQEAATSLTKSLGLNSTTVGSDASGYDPSTTSTARDLGLLAAAALKNATVASVVREPRAVLPGYGPVENTNTLLGVDGVIGLKTGTSNEARGVFLFAADAVLKGKQVVVVGAVQGAGQAAKDAMAATQKILGSLRELPASGSASNDGRPTAAQQGTDGGAFWGIEPARKPQSVLGKL